MLSDRIYVLSFCFVFFQPIQPQPTVVPLLPRKTSEFYACIDICSTYTTRTCLILFCLRHLLNAQLFLCQVPDCFKTEGNNTNVSVRWFPESISLIKCACFFFFFRDLLFVAPSRWRSAENATVSVVCVSFYRCRSKFIIQQNCKHL